MFNFIFPLQKICTALRTCLNLIALKVYLFIFQSAYLYQHCAQAWLKSVSEPRKQKFVALLIF